MPFEKNRKMNFRTVVPIEPATHKISHSSHLMFFGSCFAENIGAKLTNARFQIDVNPFGIQYNPLSIGSALLRLIDNIPYSTENIFEANGLWHSYGHHSRFSAPTAEECLQKINARFEQAVENLRQADFLFLTFGTAWAYTHCETGEIVSNCHKMPESIFERVFLTDKVIIENYSEILRRLAAINPKLQIVFTVSPMRHWKDGAHGNNLSKASLLLAIEQMQHKNISYFPAYEIMLDELRDYRFYAEDMQHPNDVAINYIWKRFSETYFTPETQKIATEAEKQNRALAHRPIIKNS